MSGDLHGYRHPDYAASFSDVAAPVLLPRSGGWILERDVPRAALRDGVGCYPVFACTDWAALRTDVDELGGRLVSLTLVTDPFAELDHAGLAEAFDFVREYKRHYVADLSRVDELPRPRNHRRNIARARANVTVRRDADPDGAAEAVWRLYSSLAAAHDLTGVRRFSRWRIEHQLRVPGAVLFTASADSEPVSFLLCYVSQGVAYAHLAASSARGYELRAAFALYEAALRELRERAAWFVLGAAPGTEPLSGEPGITRFKAGFATDARPVYLCGRIFDRAAYERLSGDRPSTEFFPAYRAPLADR